MFEFEEEEKPFVLTLNRRPKLFFNKIYKKKEIEVLEYIKKRKEISMRELFRKIKGRCEHIVEIVKSYVSAGVLIRKKLPRNGKRGRSKVIYRFVKYFSSEIGKLRMRFNLVKNEIKKKGHSALLDIHFNDVLRVFSFDKFGLLEVEMRSFPDGLFYIIDGRGRPKRIY